MRREKVESGTTSSGGESSVDTWEHAKHEEKWTEVSADNRVLEALVKEKKITWTKSGREIAKSRTVRHA